MSDHGTTKSLYGKDPDGLEFEIVWLMPGPSADRRHHHDHAPAATSTREIARYGRDTRSGLGISVPLGVTV